MLGFHIKILISSGGPNFRCSQNPTFDKLDMQRVGILAILAAISTARLVAGATLRGSDDTSLLFDDAAWLVPETRGARALKANNAAGSAVAAGPPASRIISGFANTLMEDHFAEGTHFATTLVETTDGELIRVELPEHEVYSGEPVRWEIEDLPRNASGRPGQQEFSDRCE